MIITSANYVCVGYTVFMSVRFGFFLNILKGNDGNSSDFADILISIRCTFVIKN